MKSKQTVAVGMSGGVDSSVAAYLLKKQGYNVIGFFMKNWEEEDGSCNATYDFEDVIRVCKQLDIPYYTFNFSKEYKQKVFKNFLKEYKKGLTPNPDILCNKEIKFKIFLENVEKLDADFLATGHYARNAIINGTNNLVKGKDPSKDQSYFLYTLKNDILKKVLFPIGDMLKTDVRKIATEMNFCTSTKKDSTGICFIGKRNFRTFLNQYIPYKEGNFENTEGKIIGKHKGIPFYTLGQRKGIEIGGEGDAWYVVGKDAKRNVVIIEQGENHPALFSDSLTASNLSWVSEQPSNFPFKCFAKVRYRQTEQECIIEKIEGDIAYVTFPTPQRSITPGQSVVFYKDDICLGGAIIN